MYTNKIQNTNISVDSLQMFVESILESIKANPGITWHFIDKIKLDSLLGNRGVSEEFRTLRTAIVFFSEKVFKEYINKNTIIYLFETEDVYNTINYEKNALYKKIQEHLNKNKILLDLSERLISELTKKNVMDMFKDEFDFSEFEMESEIFADILLKHIAEKATEYFKLDITVDIIKTKNRTAEFVMCRNVFVMIFRSKYPKLSQIQIAKFLDDKNRYRVMFSANRHKELFEIKHTEYMYFYFETRMTFVSKITQTQPA